jgi:hypothetical protein
MSVYQLGFSQKLIDAGNIIIKEDPHSFDTCQTVLYLSLLSCEITLKALLEKAGMKVAFIKKRSHKLHNLLLDLGRCKVLVEIGNTRRWVPATRIRGIVVDRRFANATIGNLLEAESKGASTYPNQIRYANEIIRHYPPKLMLKTAVRTLQWAKEHWDAIKT